MKYTKPEKCWRKIDGFRLQETVNQYLFPKYPTLPKFIIYVSEPPQKYIIMNVAEMD